MKHLAKETSESIRHENISLNFNSCSFKTGFRSPCLVVSRQFGCWDWLFQCIWNVWELMKMSQEHRRYMYLKYTPRPNTNWQVGLCFESLTFQEAKAFGWLDFDSFGSGALPEVSQTVTNTGSFILVWVRRPNWKRLDLKSHSFWFCTRVESLNFGTGFQHYGTRFLNFGTDIFQLRSFPWLWEKVPTFWKIVPTFWTDCTLLHISSGQFARRVHSGLEFWKTPNSQMVYWNVKLFLTGFWKTNDWYLVVKLISKCHKKS